MVRRWFGHCGDFGVTMQSSRYLPWCVGPDHTVIVAPELLRLFWGLGVEIAGATPEDRGLDCIGVPAPPGVGLPSYWWNDAAGSSIAGIPRPRVGLCWRGSGAGNQGFLPDGSDARDVPADLLRPILAFSGFTWFALQLPDHAHELPITSLEYLRVRDFADTAGVIRQLDLVISVDTAVAHLAANLGAPTWVLEPATDPVKRWTGFVAGATPFYPSVRVFSQAVAGDWAPVVAEVGRALIGWDNW